MQSKKILIISGSTPLGNGDIIEKLRLALGVTTGYKEHKASLVLLDDAVFFHTMPVEINQIGKFIKSFNFNNFDIYIDSESASQRSLNLDFKPPFKKLDRNQLLKMLDECDITISI